MTRTVDPETGEILEGAAVAEPPPVRCGRCRDAGWLRVDHPQPWTLPAGQRMVRCPCRALAD